MEQLEQPTGPSPDMSKTDFLWHVTERQHLPDILANGLRAGSYWADSKELVEYYQKCVVMEGKEPVILQAPLSSLLEFTPGPDRPGLEEPISLVIGMGEDEVWERWEETSMGWQDCLALIGSIRLKDPVPAEVFRVMDSQPSAAPKNRMTP